MQAGVRPLRPCITPAPVVQCRPIEFQGEIHAPQPLSQRHFCDCNPGSRHRQRACGGHRQDRPRHADDRDARTGRSGSRRRRETLHGAARRHRRRQEDRAYRSRRRHRARHRQAAGARADRQREGAIHRRRQHADRAVDGADRDRRQSAGRHHDLRHVGRDRTLALLRAHDRSRSVSSPASSPTGRPRTAARKR